MSYTEKYQLAIKPYIKITDCIKILGTNCIIQLPANLFFGTTIATCIMVLKRGKKDNRTLFIDATKKNVSRLQTIIN